MKLRELEAYFTKYYERSVPSDVFVNGILHADGVERGYRHVDTLTEADGIWFLCPKCFIKNGGSRGTHLVGVGFAERCPPRSYMQDLQGKDTRWNVSGSGLDDLVLTPSIQLLCRDPVPPGWCAWHGFVGSGGVPPGETA